MKGSRTAICVHTILSPGSHPASSQLVQRERSTAIEWSTNRRSVTTTTMVLVIVARDIVVTLLRLYGLRNNKPLKTELFAKWKTTFQFLLIAFILIYHNLVKNPFGYTLNPNVVSYVNESGLINTGLFVVVMITLYSGFRYYFGNRKIVRQIAVGIYRSLLNS